MSKNFSALNSHPFKAGADISRPKQVLQQNVAMESPAVSVMTDLCSVSVINVRAKTTLEKANDKMIRYGVRMLLVMDEADKVTGILTATDVLGEKPVRFLQQMGGTHANILVSDVMTVQQELEVLKLEDVQNANVGNILATLRVSGRHHAMVVEEKADGNQTVRGLFSVTQIARQLGVQIKTAEVAKIFAEIETSVNSQ